MDEYRIDAHKLIYHIDRLHDWLSGGVVYPIYMEASPSGACNHRCVFCALDFMEYRADFLDADIFCERLTELGRLGLKSVMYGGEGEPLLHKQIARIIRHGKESGIDNALTTNGVLLKPELAAVILPHMEWIKVSINAGTREGYAKVHRTKPEDFDTVISNLSHAVELKKSKGYSCALGMQMVLIPENGDEAEDLAKAARDCGVDYLVIKPYSQHPLSRSHEFESVAYAPYVEAAQELVKLSDSRFKVIFRANAMRKWDEGARSYERCYALPFWTYIDSRGDVWGCSCYLGEQSFLYGNIYKSTFKEIWEGAVRTRSVHTVENELDTTNCRVNCRMDEINRYLWELKHPPAHVNFI